MLAAAPLGAGVLVSCTLPPRSFEASGDEARIPLAGFPELERPGGLVRVRYRRAGQRERAVFVRAEEGGRYTALSAVCTHQGCLVGPSGQGFRCPCHGSTYDREGRNTGGPAHRPLERFEALPEGGTVVVRLTRGAQAQ